MESLITFRENWSGQGSVENSGDELHKIKKERKQSKKDTCFLTLNGVF